MTRLLARLLNKLPPRCSYLFPKAVVREAVFMIAAELQAYKLEAQLTNPHS